MNTPEITTQNPVTETPPQVQPVLQPRKKPWLWVILVLIVVVIVSPIPTLVQTEVLCLPCSPDLPREQCPKCSSKGDITWEPSILQRILGKLSKKDQPGIQIQSEMQPTPIVQAVYLNNWETYRNDLHTYEIKIPPQWEYIAHSSNFPDRESWQARDGSSFEIIVTKNSFDSLEAYLANRDEIDQTSWEGSPAKEIVSSRPTKVGSIESIGRSEKWLAADFTVEVTYVLIDGNVYSFTIIPTSQDPEYLVTRTAVFQDYSLVLSTFKFLVQNSTDTSNWQTYTDTKMGYSIRYPAGWRQVEFQGGMGVGPQEIGEDVKWGVNYYDSKQKSIDDIVREVGSQFSDRQETREDITFNGMSGIKATITTDEYSDWYAEIIVVQAATGINYSISNGAIKDTEFDTFYKSFQLL